MLPNAVLNLNRKDHWWARSVGVKGTQEYTVYKFIFVQQRNEIGF